MKQEAPHIASAREALEEAGVVGDVSTRPIGSYSYQKRLKQGALVACEVHVFLLEVKRQQKTWPEKGKRQVQWFSSAEAASSARTCFERYNSHFPETALGVHAPFRVLAVAHDSQRGIIQTLRVLTL
jgi:8-oxo-dGTP pyrophosphatase MutT (NUDIX family)